MKPVRNASAYGHRVVTHRRRALAHVTMGIQMGRVVRLGSVDAGESRFGG